jgi:hypothetical protein
MAIKTYNDQNFVAIANAIRAKNGETTQYKPSEMAPAIMAIESGLELLPQDTAAGAIANFPDGSNNYPVVELIANIDPKQAGSGDPSPSNVRPISGSAEVNVSKQSKNLWKFYDNKYVAADGSFMPAGNNAISDYITVNEGDTVSFGSVNGSTLGNVAIGFYDKNKVFISPRKQGTNYVSSAVPSGARYAVASFAITSGALTEDIAIADQIQFEIGSSLSIYESYNKEVKTIDLGRTVCGGPLNVTTGELTVNYALIDLGALTWAYVAQNKRFYANAVNYNVSFPTNTSEIASIVAPIYKTISFNALTSDTSEDNCIAGVITTSPFITIRDTRYNTAADFKAAMAGIYIASKINNPQVYQLTPEQVRTLLGVNNIYADTGDVEVTYRADIDLYIAKKIAEGA